MVAGILISAVCGGLVGALVSAVGGYGIGHALLSYQAGGMLCFLMFITAVMLAPRAS